MRFTALSCSLQGNHNNNILISTLLFTFHSVTQQESFLSLSNFLLLNTTFPQHPSPFVASLCFTLICFPCWPSQEPVRNLAAAVNLGGRPQPSDTLFNASWAPQRLRVFLCGRRAASLIYLHWSWHSNLHGYLQNTLRPIISNVWVLNALMCSIKIERTGTGRNAFSLSLQQLWKIIAISANRPNFDWNRLESENPPV